MTYLVRLDSATSNTLINILIDWNDHLDTYACLSEELSK